MMKDSSIPDTDGIVSAWRNFFLRWPSSLPRSGAIVTSFGEQIVFREFMTTDAMLLVERRMPDQIGTKQVILPYANIDALKITDPVTNEVFVAAGFRGKPASS